MTTKNASVPAGHKRVELLVPCRGFRESTVVHLPEDDAQQLVDDRNAVFTTKKLTPVPKG